MRAGLAVGAVMAAILVFLLGRVLVAYVHATHAARRQQPYKVERFAKVVTTFERRAGPDTTLLEVELGLSGVRLLALQPEGLKEYTIDDEGKLLAVRDAPGSWDLTKAFPVTRLQAGAPQRIFDAIASDPAHPDLRYVDMRLRVDPFSNRLRWTATPIFSGSLADYEALPDGTLVKRPAASPDVAAFARCIAAAGTDATKARACRKLLPAAR